jgi:Molybdopterin-binding domain of aldehyde dehydrogenase
MMASLPVRDPVGEHLLTPQNAAMLVIDYQPGQFAAVSSMDRDLLLEDIVSSVKIAKLFGLPIDRTSINAWEDADFLSAVRATGRIINPKTARSQLVGGMTWGLSMPLHEESVLDPRFGDYVNDDFAEYHIATNADVGTVEVAFLDEDDPHVNPMGVKGIGELGIVGTAAAIANAVYHATGIRVRDLPIRLDKLLP